jgi:hypothetical protein
MFFAVVLTRADNIRGMKSFIGRTGLLAAATAAFVFFCLAQAPTPTQARRLILKDGSYQSVTKYEIQGDRVRYFSAERGEWEEVPRAMIDWDATDKFEQGRQDGKFDPEAAELDKELEAERKAAQARSPEVAPGLHLPDEGGMFLLDTYQNQPQLAELQQSGGDVDKNTKSNILRAAINPLAGAKQTIDLPGAHAKIQSHTAVPSLYINIDLNDNANLPDPNLRNPNLRNKDQGAPAAAQAPTGAPPPLSSTERFKIIRIDVKGSKRVAGAVKIAVTGKMKTDERFVAATVTTMTGGWVKLAPTDPLAAGEYAVAEMLGKEGINLYVWDFGVNPNAPANAFTWKPDPTEAQPKTDQPVELQKREKQ